MKKNNSIKMNRFIILGIVFLFCAIIIKLFFVALSTNIDGINLNDFANNRNTTRETLYASRGSIYDINGEALATNVNSYTVIAFLEPSRTTDINKPQHVVDKPHTAEVLAPVLNMDYNVLLSLLNKDLYQVELGPQGRGITELKKAEIAALDLPGISFMSSTKRYYKMDNFASYLIGYARKNDDGVMHGEMGIESYYEDTLKGTNGYCEYQKDAYGYQIPNTPSLTEEPVSGSNIYLTIDNNIQLLLEKMVNDIDNNYEMEWMTVTVMEAKTGRIVGSASTPNFSLNTLEGVESYLNPLVSYQYEPGSTMKIFSFLAAMENNKYDGNATYLSGTKKVADATIKDFNNVGWGTITYDTGFSYSSNVAATNLALELGNEKLRSFYQKAGFGAKTGIELPEEMTGKIAFKYKSELANASFGQGITVTPIQMMQALSIISNDGDMIKPFIVDKIVDSKGNVTYQGERTVVRNVASKANVNHMKDMMKDVVYSNLTDAKYYQANNITVIGKTGTAQIAGDGGYISGKYDYVRSFAGIFPYENPEYIIYYATKQFVGPISQIAKQIRNTIEEVAKYKDIVEVESSMDQSKIISLNNYINKDVTSVVESLKNINVTPIVIGNGDVIINQYPLNKMTVVSGNKVFLLTNNYDYIMPDLKGYTSHDVITFCNLIGLKYTLNGFGKVIDTSIVPGAKIDVNNGIVINLGI